MIFILAAWCFAVYSFAGVEWVSTITTHGKGKRANNEIISYVYAQKGNLKQEFKGVSNENMFYFQDGYWLYKADDDTIYIVNDRNKSYMEMSLDGLLQMLGMFGQLVKIEITDHTIDTEVLPGETIAGYSCNHIKITTDYTMKIKIAFIKKKMIIHEVKEIWASPDMPGLAEINKMFMKKDIKTGIPDLDELIQKEMEQQKKLGFPLKVITQQVQKNKKGKVKGKNTSTMEVSKITSKTFPESFFEIPGEYDRIDSPAEGKKLGIF
jgi:hypothetical protein